MCELGLLPDCPPSAGPRVQGVETRDAEGGRLSVGCGRVGTFCASADVNSYGQFWIER